MSGQIDAQHLIPLGAHNLREMRRFFLAAQFAVDVQEQVFAAVTLQNGWNVLNCKSFFFHMHRENPSCTIP